MSVARLVLPALRWRAETGFDHEAEAIDRALEAGVGGFIVFGGDVPAVAGLTARLGQRAGRPLLIGADLERGAGQQVAGLPELPPPLALASLDDRAIVRQAGRITGAGARQVGINWVFGPVADLDLEPTNPIVQTRSFGSDPIRVGELVGEWIWGGREAGVLTCAKHFPGHGRTTQDSHDRTPSVAAPLDVLERTDLVPFRSAVAAGVDSVMTAHVSYPAVDPSGAPATRSRPIHDLLRSTLGFAGLVVSDALIMEGFAGGLGPVDGAVAAVAAGVDILLYPADVAATVAGLERAVNQDPRFAERVGSALGRYRRALRTAGAAPAADATGGERSGVTSAGIAGRLVERGAPRVELRQPIELVVVDDDREGAFPASPNDYLERRLDEAGVSLGPGGSRIVVALAEPRASKGRAGFGSSAMAALANAAPGAGLVVLFAHPRLATELPARIPVLCAWHRQRLMQEAVAEWVLGRLVQ
jgi:beta-glucosidase